MFLLLLVGPVGRGKVEQMDLHLRTEVVAHGELLQLGSQRVGRHAVHLQRTGRHGSRVGDDEQQRMSRGDAPHGTRLLAQFVAETAVERLGVETLRRLYGSDVAFDAQTYLVNLPVLELSRKQLISQRPLLAEQFQREMILERMGNARFGRIERRASKDAFERLRNFQLHVASLFFEFAKKTTPKALLLHRTD